MRNNTLTKAILYITTIIGTAPYLGLEGNKDISQLLTPQVFAAQQPNLDDKVIGSEEQIKQPQVPIDEIYVQSSAKYFVEGKIKEARDAAETALFYNPRNIDAHVNLSNAYSRLGEDIIAEDILKRALKLDEKNIHVHNSFSMVYIALKMFGQAADHANFVLKLEPTNGIAHYQLASALYNLGLYDNAIIHFEKAAMYGPSARDALNMIKIIGIEKKLLGR